MTGLQKARNAGLGVAALGALVWLIAVLASRGDAGEGANIGAGMGILAGMALVALGLTTAILLAVLGALRR